MRYSATISLACGAVAAFFLYPVISTAVPPTAVPYMTVGAGLVVAAIVGILLSNRDVG